MPRVKLTLSAERDLVDLAKRLARARNLSVSALFARLVSGLHASGSIGGELPPVTRRASGIVELPAGRSDDELLKEAIADGLSHDGATR